MSAWSALRPVPGDSTTPASGTAYPSVATTRDGTVYLVGNQLGAAWSAPVPENPLAAWAVGPAGAWSLGHPIGTFRFAYPQALVDTRDRLHVVWGEPAGGARTILQKEWDDEHLTTLWTAVYESTRGWSVPRPLFAAGSGEVLHWNQLVVPAQSEPRPPHVSVAVSVRGRPPSGGHILLVSFAEADSLVASAVQPRVAVLDGSVATAERRVSPGIHASVASAGQALYLGFIAAAPTRGGSDINSVFLQASPDGGRTWREPVLVSRSGEYPAYELTTLATSDGTVHLVWQQLRAAAVPVIRHVASTDGGRTWSAPTDLEPPPTANVLKTAVDACGTVHVVWDHLDTTVWRAHVDAATFQGGAWSEVEHLFPTLASNFPMLHRAHDGRLLLAFRASQGDTTAGAAPIADGLLYSELRTMHRR